MGPVQKALWYVETHFQSAVTLEGVAAACCISPYHLTRVFASSMGVSLMKYARRRRLTEAAKAIANGAPDILTVALDYGYGSHEAFSRAFKEEFTATPESVRTSGTNHLLLTEAILMTATPAPKLADPQIEMLSFEHLVGIVERHECESPSGIPKQWQRFAPYLGNIPGQVGKVAYGVCYNFGEDGKFDYVTCVEAKRDMSIPFGLVGLDLPEHKYAVFRHDGHIAEIRAVIAGIWNNALPKSGYESGEGPMIERYGEQFDAGTGTGGFNICVPVK